MRLQPDIVCHPPMLREWHWSASKMLFGVLSLLLILPVATTQGFQVRNLSAENDHILQFLDVCGARVVVVSDDGPPKPACPDDLRDGRIIVNLIDAAAIRNCLTHLESVPAKQTLIIGNSTANFDLDTILDMLLRSKSVEHLVLDSVDCTAVGYDQLNEHGISIRRIDNAAVNCVNCSYAFAQGRVPASFETVAVTDGSTAAWFEPIVATGFIGREWHPEPILPLPRDAVRFFRHFRNLKEVRFSGIQICDDDLTVLNNSSGLELLKLDGCLLKGVGLRHVNGKSLTMLSLAENNTLEVLPCDCLPKLKQLKIDECKGGMGVLENIAQCRQLQLLDIGTMRWTCEDLVRVLGSSTSLKEVVLLPCEAVGISVGEFENKVKSRFSHVEFKHNSR